jgi:hypothetical protein
MKKLLSFVVLLVLGLGGYFFATEGPGRDILLNARGIHRIPKDAVVIKQPDGGKEIWLNEHEVFYVDKNGRETWRGFSYTGRTGCDTIGDPSPEFQRSVIEQIRSKQ